MTEPRGPADVVQATISESAAIRRLNDAREKIVTQTKISVLAGLIKGEGVGLDPHSTGQVLDKFTSVGNNLQW